MANFPLVTVCKI